METPADIAGGPVYLYAFAVDRHRAGIGRNDVGLITDSFVKTKIMCNIALASSQR